MPSAKNPDRMSKCLLTVWEQTVIAGLKWHYQDNMKRNSNKSETHHKKYQRRNW